MIGWKLEEFKYSENALTNEEILSRIGHELQTPLVTIGAALKNPHSEILRERAISSLEKLKTRWASIVEESGSVRPHFQAVDLGELLISHFPLGEKKKLQVLVDPNKFLFAIKLLNESFDLKEIVVKENIELFFSKSIHQSFLDQGIGKELGIAKRYLIEQGIQVQEGHYRLRLWFGLKDALSLVQWLIPRVWVGLESVCLVIEEKGDEQAIRKSDVRFFGRKDQLLVLKEIELEQAKHFGKILSDLKNENEAQRVIDFLKLKKYRI